MTGEPSILMIQFNESKNSRTFYTFKSKENLVKGVVEQYQGLLRKNYGLAEKQQIKYKLCDIIKFINSLQDISALMKIEKAPQFVGRGREWLINEVLEFYNSI